MVANPDAITHDELVKADEALAARLSDIGKQIKSVAFQIESL